MKLICLIGLVCLFVLVTKLTCPYFGGRLFEKFDPKPNDIRTLSYGHPYYYKFHNTGCGFDTQCTHYDFYDRKYSRLVDGNVIILE